MKLKTRGIAIGDVFVCIVGALGGTYDFFNKDQAQFKVYLLL